MYKGGNLFPHFTGVSCFIATFPPTCFFARCLSIDTKLFIMDKMQKLEMMDKILRELDDVKSSQTSVLKKITQIEAENINLGVQMLDQSLPDVHESVDKGIEDINSLLEKFQLHRNKFAKDNKLEAGDTLSV